MTAPSNQERIEAVFFLGGVHLAWEEDASLSVVEGHSSALWSS